MPKACAACHTVLKFIKTKSGNKNMPCEADPIDGTEADDGELYITLDGEMIRFDIENVKHVDIEELYIPHWKNCGGAARFRK